MGSKKIATKPKGKTKSPAKKPAASRVKSSGKSKARVSSRPSRTVRPARTERLEGAKSGGGKVVVETPPPVRLLRETKTTTAALAMLERGIKLIYQKEFKKARNELKLLLESHPGESEILASARSYLQICVREDPGHKRLPTNIDQLYNLGILEHNGGDYDKAIAYFRQSLEKHPDSDHIHYSLAASYAMKGQVGNAVEHLRRAVALNEENRIFAKNDPDFTTLIAQSEYGEILGPGQPATGG